MMRSINHRRGLTLLEVVVAMAIFLLAVGVLWQLFAIAGERARDVNLQARTSMACQSKLAEIMVGAEAPNSSDGYNAFTDDANKDLQWKVEVNQGEIADLYQVKVWVKFEIDNRTFESHLCQNVLDPAIRGSTLDQPIMAQPGTATPDSATDPATPANGGTTPNTTPAGGTPTPAGGTPAGGGKGAAVPGGGKGGAVPGGGKGGVIPGGGKGGGAIPGGGKGGGGVPGGGAPGGGGSKTGAVIGGGAPTGGGGAPTGGGKGGGAPTGGGKGGGGKGG